VVSLTLLYNDDESRHSRETRESPVSELQIHFPLTLIFLRFIVKVK